MMIYPSLDSRLKSQHEAIGKITSTLNSNRVALKPAPGKWNIHDNVAHLARYQPVFLDRIKHILNTDEPFFGRYVAEEDAEFEYWIDMDMDTLNKQLTDDREEIYQLISSLTDSQLARIGVHKKFGSLNIVQWTEFFLLHEAHHIYTIFQLAYDVELR